MKKNKLFIFILALILSISCFSTITFSHSISLTSDDSELNWYFVNRGKGYTPKILDILKEEKVPAAFFVVKPYITQNPEIIKRMADEGHLVCNHSNHHPSMATITDPEKFKAEFTDVEAAYKEIVGSDMPKFFRPPMGKYSVNSLKKTKELGYKTIFWSFAYKDWIIDNQPSEEEAIKKITNGVHPGCIMLIHAVSKTNTAVLKTVIEQIRADGYEFKSLNELPEYQ